MHRSAMLLAVVSLSVSTLVHAQGRPTAPGVPGTETPQTIVDSTGIVIGEVMKIEGAGLASASVKYVLPNAEHVILSVTGQFINTIGTSVHAYPGPDQARVFFKEADCTGLAYRRMAFPGPAWQLTRWQAMILDNVVTPSAPPPPSGSCPAPYGSRWLYAVDMTAGGCPLEAGPENEVTFAAYFGTDPFAPFGAETNCVAPTGGITFGGPNPTGVNQAHGSFIAYTRYEDLLSKYKAPFYIP